MRTMSRGSDSRWYEPPAPRSWKTNPTSLQRIESAENLRRSLLDSAAKTPGALPYRQNLRPGTRTMNRSFDYDKTRSMASLPSTPLVLRGSLSGSAKYNNDASRIVPPSYTRQLSGSVKDLSSSSTGFLNKLKTQENAEKILNTPPSRPRTTTLTKFRPLPAIKHSAGSTRSDPSTDNNNTGGGKNPPPLLRSRTFDVIDTNIDNLPVVGDEEDDERSYTEYSDYYDDGEGDDDEGEEDESDSSSDSGSGSDSGKNSESDASDSGVVSAESNRNEVAKAKKEQNEAIFERGMINSAVPVQTVTVTIEGKLISEYVSQTKLGALNRLHTRYGFSFFGNSDEELGEGENSNGENEEEEDGEEEEEEGEGEEEGEEDEGEGDDEGGGEEEEEEEDETMRVGATLPDISEDEEMFALDGGIEEDIIVYVKMPDDTLMLSSSPRERTLRELLTIVKDTHLHGSCLVISRKGLSSSDLDKSLGELGIHDNTTLHLIAE
ncbi:clumping factor B-like [Macrobrachium rosenbergii]|uniref:clumping factor B-like n=1 Tax=Macrobrachium rosenbergii TaxID=79674 RepID=UPI0034D41CE6